MLLRGRPRIKNHGQSIDRRIRDRSIDDRVRRRVGRWILEAEADDHDGDEDRERNARGERSPHRMLSRAEKFMGTLESSRSRHQST